MRTLTLVAVVLGLIALALANASQGADGAAVVHAGMQSEANGVRDDDGKKKPKGVYHDVMEEIEHLYDDIKEIRKQPEEYAAAVPKAKKLQVHFEKLIPLTGKRVKELGTAKEEARQLEAKALMIESLAHCYGLQAALMQKDADAVNARLRKLNSAKNSAHREFQP